MGKHGEDLDFPIIFLALLLPFFSALRFVRLEKVRGYLMGAIQIIRVDVSWAKRFFPLSSLRAYELTFCFMKDWVGAPAVTIAMKLSERGGEDDGDSNASVTWQGAVPVRNSNLVISRSPRVLPFTKNKMKDEVVGGSCDPDLGTYLGLGKMCFGSGHRIWFLLCFLFKVRLGPREENLEQTENTLHGPGTRQLDGVSFCKIKKIYYVVVWGYVYFRLLSNGIWLVFSSSTMSLPKFGRLVLQRLGLLYYVVI